MFIRKRRNRSGSTSIVVVNKRHGQFVEVRNFGTAETDDDINKLYAQAHKWLMSNGGQQSIDFDDLKGREYEETRRVIDNMDAAMINGTQLLLTQIYDSIGFDRIHDDVLRHLVIARVSQPMSKLATVEYLKSYYDEDVDLNRIYRYMDRLYKTQQELVQNISVEHTRKILGGNHGFRSAQVSKAMAKAGYKPSSTSNHLTGCAVDIQCLGKEQAIRYAAILVDIADGTKRDFDELLIEWNARGSIWLHFAVRPQNNRRKIAFMAG